MRRDGRRPQPTVLKIARGNPGKRPLNAREPKPVVPAKLPPCPDWLPAEGKRLWSSLGDKLLRTGLLTELDLETLAMLCAAWAQWRDAEAYIQEHGATYTMDSGRAYRHPAAVAGDHAAKLVFDIAREFGLTPSARSRIATPLQPGGEDAFTKFMKARDGTQ